MPDVLLLLLNYVIGLLMALVLGLFFLMSKLVRSIV